MSDETRTTLEERLEAATRWEGATPGLWEKAMELEAAPVRRDWRAEVVTAIRRPSGIIAACLAVALIGVIVVAMNAPVARQHADRTTFMEGRHRSSMARVMPDGKGNWKSGGFGIVASAPPPPPSQDAKTELSFDSSDRVVIRKATIEIESADVRGVFAKVAMLVSEAGGEYVQESSLTGGAIIGPEGARQPFHGTITLRVSVKRLSEVMNKLRELGTVTSETSGGEDVTEQAVDLEARLRNEERVETELLELMSSRKDSPLKEILELREQIGHVRERIERLAAQKDRLSHLASLATVLVIVREPNTIAPVEPAKGDTSGYFFKQMDAAWKNGLLTLSDSISWIVGVIVGGAIWWMAVLVIMVVLVRLLRRPAPAAGRPTDSSGSSPQPKN